MAERRYLSVALPKLNVVAVYKLFCLLLGLGVIGAVEVNRAVKMAVRSDDVNAIIRHIAAPSLGGSVQNSQSPMDAEGGAVMFCIWLRGLIQNRPLRKSNYASRPGNGGFAVRLGFGPAGKTQLVFNQSNGTASDSHNCPAMRVEPSCMRIEYVSVQLTALAPGLLLLASLSLGGCASSSVGSSPMDARAEVTDHAKTTAYPAVEDVPPGPDKPAMTADEQSKLKKALIAAREGQAKEKAKQDALRAEPAKP